MLNIDFYIVDFYNIRLLMTTTVILIACVPFADLVCLICLLQSIVKLILQEFANELKLVKVDSSRYWQT